MKAKFEMIDNCFGGIERELHEGVKKRFVGPDVDEAKLGEKMMDLAREKKFFR